MSVATVKDQLAALELTISGIVASYAQAPASLPRAMLPAIVNFTGAATYSGANALQFEEREYILRLYVANFAENIPGEAEALVEPCIPLVRNVFLSRRSLKRLAGTLDAKLTGDSGVAGLVYAGENYIGAEFRLTIIEPIVLTAVEV